VPYVFEFEKIGEPQNQFQSKLLIIDIYALEKLSPSAPLNLISAYHPHHKTGPSRSKTGTRPE
jgi:hypothetical protein